MFQASARYWHKAGKNRLVLYSQNLKSGRETDIRYMKKHTDVWSNILRSAWKGKYRRQQICITGSSIPISGQRGPSWRKRRKRRKRTPLLKMGGGEYFFSLNINFQLSQKSTQLSSRKSTYDCLLMDLNTSNLFSPTLLGISPCLGISWYPHFPSLLLL